LSQSESRVKIAQKTVKDAPIDKLYDGWIAMLTGAHGLVEINSRLRADGHCRQPSDGADVPNNRWCNTRWMRARQSM